MLAPRLGRGIGGITDAPARSPKSWIRTDADAGGSWDVDGMGVASSLRAAMVLVLCGLMLAAARGSSAAGSASAGSGGALVYTAVRGNSAHLWLLNVTTGAKRQLTHGHYREEAPSWSPDGKRLVFADTRKVRVPGLDAVQITPLLAVIDLRRGSVRTLTDGSGFDESPAWSPDGRRIAFVRTSISGGTATTHSEIWVMRADGRGARALTQNTVDDLAPAWSADGRQVAFVRMRGETADLWTMRADGSKQHVLVRNGWRGAWSPDGRQLAFGRLTGATSGCCLVTDLYVGNASGAHARLMLRNAGRAAWSPDGTRLALQRLEGERSHVWVVNADGTGLRRLTGGRGNEYVGGWRPGS